MNHLGLFVSATIVLIFSVQGAGASPQEGVTALDPAREQQDFQPLDDNMAVSTPPELKNKPAAPNARYYPYRQQLTFRTGFESDDHGEILDGKWVLGFQYLFPKFLAPKLEAGADLIEEGKGHLHAGIRWIARERSYFRPSLKAGLDHLAESKEGMATLTSWENYFIRLSACIEYVVWNPFSVRLEHEFLASLEETRSALTLGLSHGW